METLDRGGRLDTEVYVADLKLGEWTRTEVHVPTQPPEETLLGLRALLKANLCPRGEDRSAYWARLPEATVRRTIIPSAKSPLQGSREDGMAQPTPPQPPAQPAGPGRARAYKDHKIYMCFALNRIVAELRIDIYQPELEVKLDGILNTASYRVTKEDIKHEIRSNHFMTEKVLEKLKEEGLIDVAQVGKEYQIRITRSGVLHVRKFNEFYKVMYREQIMQHYAYRGLPWWFK